MLNENIFYVYDENKQMIVNINILNFYITHSSHMWQHMMDNPLNCWEILIKRILEYKAEMTLRTLKKYMIETISSQDSKWKHMSKVHRLFRKEVHTKWCGSGGNLLNNTVD